MKRVLLVRHALTPYDIAGPEGRFCGRSDPSLSEAGIIEAKQLGELLKGVPVSKLFASPLARALETARHIVSEGALPVVIEPLLSEIDYGDWEGLSKQEIVSRFANEYERFTLDPVLSHPPKGEAPADCLSRGLTWISNLKDDYVIAVTHKTWTRLLLCELLKIPISEYRRALDLKIASITVLVGDKGQWRMDALNYCATRKRILGFER